MISRLSHNYQLNKEDIMIRKWWHNTLQAFLSGDVIKEEIFFRPYREKENQ